MKLKLADPEAEYAKDDKLKREDVQALLEWSKRQPHLPEITELQVILFLHSCYYGMEAAKSAIDNYFTVRTHYPEIFCKATEDVIHRVLNTHFLTIFPKRTPEDYIIICTQVIDRKPENFNCIGFVQIVSMLLGLNLHQNGPVNGLVVLFDMKGVTFGHLTRLHLMSVKQILYFLQEAAPLRIRNIHFINVDAVTDKFISILKPFMKKEIYESVRRHTESVDTLYQYIPKDCLPREFGGEMSSLDTLQDECKKSIQENSEFFQWHDGQVIDEKKRFGKTQNIGSGYGMDGSFKKIELD